ncbi:TlpA family protein disulfide reductase [Gemmatimonadota bacterium]
MTAMYRLLAVAFLVGLGTAFAATLRAQETRIGIERGSVPEAPTLANVQGGEVDLGQYFGDGPVLIEFWATWCENCEALHPRMLEAHERYGDRLTFVAIAVAVGQSERRVRGHLEKHPVPYPTLWDGRGEAVRAFETPATSYIVILDAAGRVAYTGIGRDQDIDAAIRSVLESGPDS